MTKRIPPLSPEDKLLFEEALKGTKRIVPGKVNLRQPRTPIISRKNTETAPNPSATFEIDYAVEVSQNDFLDFARNGINQKQRKRLRTGQFPLDASLDLHGLTVNQAQIQVFEFLQRCIYSHKQFVRVVHGKGHQAIPPLKNLVNRLLRSHPDVLAFNTAHAHGGGYGAVNILLKLKPIAEEE